MSRAAVVLASFVAVALLGCGADLGGGAGIGTRTGHAVGFGRLAGSTKIPLVGGAPINEKGLLVGGSLESRAEQSVGSSWDLGMMLGWGENPSEIDGVWGWEAYGEFGTPIHETLFRKGDLFAGAAFAVPIHFGSPRQVTDLNDATWVLTRRFEIVPLVRGRFHLDHPDVGSTTTQVDVEMGLTFRLRTFTDLF